MVTSKYTTKNAQMKGFHLPSGGNGKEEKKTLSSEQAKKVESII